MRVLFVLRATSGCQVFGGCMAWEAWLSSVSPASYVLLGLLWKLMFSWHLQTKITLVIVVGPPSETSGAAERESFEFCRRTVQRVSSEPGHRTDRRRLTISGSLVTIQGCRLLRLSC
jgi:hypothetical protein